MSNQDAIKENENVDTKSEKITSREQRRQKLKLFKVRQGKEKSAEQEERQKRQKKPKVRLVPIWLRLVLILIFCAAGLAAGIAIGYGVIGDGQVSDAFEKETWQHIVDIVVKGTKLEG